MAQPRPRVPWQRYWCPLGGSIASEEGTAFLSDPGSDYGRFSNPRICQLDALLPKPFVVLCGEPGMGKTDAVDELLRQNAHAAPGCKKQLLHVAWKSCRGPQDFDARTVDSVEWQAWLKSDSYLTLIIDGVDEGRLLLPNFLEWLTDTLRRDVPTARLQLILACRSLDWPRALGNSLAALWPRREEPEKEPPGHAFELCPLTRSAVRLAADTWGIPAEPFLLAVLRQHVTALAARPVTLHMLANEFVNHGGQFPGGYRQLYLRACRGMCRDPDPDRASRLRLPRAAPSIWTPGQLHVVAQRIAAALMLGGRNAVYLGHDSLPADSADIPIEELAGGHENDGDDTFTVTEDAIRACLSTLLFDSKGPDRFGFHHQTFAECLTGKYLALVALTLLRTLLCQSDGVGEYVIPQLAETAAWVGFLHSDFQKLLLTVAPEVVLRGGVSEMDDLAKFKLAERLLEQSDAGLLFDDRMSRIRLADLSFKNADKLLLKWIFDKRRSQTARLLALEMARYFECRQLFSELLILAKKSTDPIHEEAFAVAAALATPDSAFSLIPFAVEPAPGSVGEKFRVLAIRGLIANVWSVADTIPFLSVVSETPDSLGHILEEHLKPSDTIPVLNWFAQCKEDFSDDMGLTSFYGAACQQALNQWACHETRRSLARCFIAGNGEQHILWATMHSAIKKELHENETLRREFTTEIIATAGTDPFYSFRIYTHCCEPGDLHWLLNTISHAPIEQRSLYAEAVYGLGHPMSIAPVWDLLLQRIKEIPELAMRFGPDAWDLDGPEAARARKSHLVSLQIRQQMEAEEKRRRSRNELVAEALTASENGRPWAWWALARRLFVKDKGEEWRSHGRFDVAHSPGWISASQNDRERFRESARRFLLWLTEPLPKRPAHHTNFSDGAFAAAWLLRDEICFAGDLQISLTSYCIPAIVWSERLSATSELIELAYHLAPDTCRKAFIRQMIYEAGSNEGSVVVGVRFRHCWDAGLSAIVSRFLLRRWRKPETVRCLLKDMAYSDRSGVRAIWHQLVSIYRPGSELRAKSLGAATEVIIEVCPSECWLELRALMREHTDVATHALLHAAYCGRASVPGREKEMSASQLAEFYLFLTETFPPHAPEEQWSSKGGTVTPRMEAGLYRDGVLQALCGLGTQEAVDELAKLASVDSKQRHPWIRKRWLDSVDVMRRKAWKGIATRELVASISQRVVGRVESAGDLALVVLDALARLQSSLTAAIDGDLLRYWRFDYVAGRREFKAPMQEVDVSREIASFLKRELTNAIGAVVRREVTVQHDARRTDVEVTLAAGGAHDARELTVVIEVKGCWNREIPTAPEEQLLKRYLRECGRTHGIFLVAWFNHKGTPLKTRLAKDTQAEVEQYLTGICREVESRNPGFQILPFVLNCRR